MASVQHCDLAIAGGGLAGALIALALAEKRPDLDVRIVEGADMIGGNHAWSFFGADIAPSERWLIERLVVHAWPGYSIAFPRAVRQLPQPYYTIESTRLDAVVRETIAPERLMLGAAIEEVTQTTILLANGDRITATGVIDARGPGDLTGTMDLGWQKFVGRDYRLEAAHGLANPIVMDATVEQIDGYRFVYALPFGPKRMFVEDTYYSDTPDLDVKAVGQRVAAYAAARGWQAKRKLREETGVLPITIGGDFEAYWRSTGSGIAKAGMRAGLFQPTTGYSLPDAVRLAIAIAGERDLSGASLARFTHDYAAAAWRGQRFYRMLNAMLFRAARPEERWRVIERFYGLGPNLIRRFYAGRSTFADKARILTGRPPVPVGRAIRVLKETSWRA